VILALFGATRFAALYEQRLTFLAGWLGLWAAILFLLSAEASIGAQLELNVDPSAVAVFSGVLSSACCTCIVLSSRCIGNRPISTLREFRTSHRFTGLSTNDEEVAQNANMHESAVMVGKASSA